MTTLQLDERGVRLNCPQCGQANRLPYERLRGSARCGKCGAELGPPASPVEVANADQFQALTVRSALPVVMDFWAAWCGPCRMVAPELEKLARARAGDFVIAKVDTEALPGLSQQLGVRSIPTLAVFRGGRELARTAGARPAPAIAAFIDETLAAS